MAVSNEQQPVLVIMGVSGSGKSTVPRFWPASSGGIWRKETTCTQRRTLPRWPRDNP